MEVKSVHERSRLLVFPKMEGGESSQHQHCLLLGGENHQAFTKEGKPPKSIQQLQSRGCLCSEAHAREVTA